MSGLHRINGQPDDPGIRAICPCCRQPWPDEDGDLEGLVRKNIGHLSLARIALAANVSVSRIERVAKRIKKLRRT